MKFKRYTYEPHHGYWRVMAWEKHGNGAVGSKVAEFFTKEEAKAEVYRLNGWRKPETRNPKPATK